MKFDSSLPNYDWDQVLPIGVTTEQLYQAFKARLMRELVAEGGRIYDTTKSKEVPQRFALVDAV